jgi:ribonuclease HI
MHTKHPSERCMVHTFTRNEDDSAYTNNQVEYQSMLLGLSKFKDFTQNTGKGAVKWNVTVTGDSELVINQMNGKARVFNKDLVVLHSQAKEIEGELEANQHNITFIHTRRENNTTADLLSKEALFTKNADRQYGCLTMKDSKLPELAEICSYHSGSIHPTVEVSDEESEESEEENDN